MKRQIYLAARALALCTALSVRALAQDRDALSCATTVSGGDIRIGSPVYDSAGHQIGTVSISQCMTKPEEAKLRVRLGLELGSEIKVFDLAGVTAEGDAVKLPLSLEQIAQIPAAPNAYAMVQTPTDD